MIVANKTRWLSILALLCAYIITVPVSAAGVKEPVGYVSFIIGQATVTHRDESTQILLQNDEIYPGDQISTNSSSHAHIKFSDDGSISIRPNSILIIEHYDYNQEDPESSVIKFKLQTGTIRSISGKAAGAAHDRYRLNTPIAALGVLGTDYVIRAENDKVWAAVYSGAIALSLFNDHCTEQGLGACNNATVLTAEMGDLLLELDVRTLTTNMKRQSSEGENKDDPEAVVTLESTFETDTDDINQLTENEPLIGDSTSPDSREEVLQPSGKIVFARWPWVKQLEGDSISQNITDARKNRHITEANNLFGIFRTNSDLTELMPSTANYDFQLIQGEVHFAEFKPDGSLGDYSKGELTDAKLNIDFSLKQFTTHLEMTHNIGGDATLDVQGDILENGEFRAEVGNSIAEGVLTLDGVNAGLLFEQQQEEGIFKGITEWGR
ncbi:MAG: hypothetical protein GQ475_07445 [Methylococcaceae bacterium]|nr:hypothetical protein [Methylococcaceae bacterium]